MLHSVFRNGRLLAVAVATSVVVMAGWAPSGVAAADPHPAPSAAAVLPSGDLVITPDQWAVVNEKVGFIAEKGLWGEFVIKKNGTLTTVDSLPEMQAKFDLSDEQVNAIRGILDFAARTKDVKVPKESGGISPNVFLNGTVIYVTFSEVGVFLITAAMAGPYALAAAINAMGWVLGGPVGGAIAFIMSVIGIATIAGLAYQIVQGYYYHQGIYFGIVWNGIFPNYTQGNWCGCS
jgi:hypothetical protein